MAKITLTKRNYLGEGYMHQYIHNTTGAIKLVECTQAEYEALATENNSAPNLADHTWQGSSGGTIKVDTPEGHLGPNEYCVLLDKKEVVRLTAAVQGKIEPEVILPEGAVVDNQVDDTYVEEIKELLKKTPDELLENEYTKEKAKLIAIKTVKSI